MSAHDPLLVRLQVALIVMFESHAASCQLIDRTIDIVHRKIKNCERRRNVIGLWINEDIVAAGQMQSKQAMVLRCRQSQRLGVELFLLRDVRRRESTECFAVFQHYISSPPFSSFGVTLLVPSNRQPGFPIKNVGTDLKWIPAFLRS